jgi:hypothetical protein
MLQQSGAVLNIDTGVGTLNTGITLPTNAWFHLAYTRQSGRVRVFVDGVLRYNVADTTSYGNASVDIGGAAGFSQSWDGYISNARIIKGTVPAAYQTSSTTNGTSIFTSPTGPLTAVTGTELLTCQSNRFVDSNTQTTAKTITVTGSPRVTAFSPFGPTAVYNPAVHGGSGYFDGTGDWLSGVGTTSSFNFLHNTTALFTIEAWVYITSTGSQQTIICTNNDASSAAVGCWFTVETNNTLRLFITKGSVGNFVINASSSASVQTNTWSHIAVTYNQSLSSNNATFYINGGSAGNATKLGNSPVDSNATTAMNVGSYNGGGAFMNGYIFNLRISNSIVYNSSFTPPTAPVTATPNTQLLLNFTDAAILDSTGRQVLETLADAKTSSVVTKFTGGSMLFDGTGDYLTIPAPPGSTLDLKSGDFTIEAWINYSTANSTICAIYRIGDSSVVQYIFTVNSTNKLELTVYASSNSFNSIASSGNISTNTWTHVAVTRAANTLRLFINGVLDGTTTVTVGDLMTLTGSTKFSVGAWSNLGPPATVQGFFNGYIQDLRITKGYARYTANFTAPTVPARLK